MQDVNFAQADQTDGAAQIADVDWFIITVKDKYVLVKILHKANAASFSPDLSHGQVEIISTGNSNKKTRLSCVQGRQKAGSSGGNNGQHYENAETRHPRRQAVSRTQVDDTVSNL